MALSATDPAERILRLLDKVEPKLRRAILNALVAARSQTTLKTIATLIENGRFEEAITAAVNAGTIRIANGYAGVYTLAGQETAKFLQDALEVVIDFDQVNQRAVNVMQQERLRLIREFTREQRLATREALTSGIRQGLNPREQARNFRSSIGLTTRQQRAVQNYRRLLSEGSSEALSRSLRDRRFDRTVARAVQTGQPLTKAQIDRMVDRYSERYVIYRSEVIARTEALRAVHAGTEEMYRQGMDAGHFSKEDLKRKWVTAKDARVRHSHVGLNGLVRGIDETFPGDEGPIRYPGDPEAPAAETVQCFLPWSPLDRSGIISAIKTREYRGEFVDIFLLGGNKLSLTVNHPVLTESGFKAAGSLVEGEDLLQHVPAEQRFSSENPEVDDRDIAAEKLYDLLAISGRTKRVSHFDVNLHGYTPDHDVDVVAAKSVLLGGVQAFLVEKIKSLGFKNADFTKGSLFGGRLLFQELKRPLGTAHRGVSCGSDSFSLLRTGTGEAEFVSFASGSYGQAAVYDPVSDCPSGNPQSVGNFQDGQSVMIHGKNLGQKNSPAFMPARVVKVVRQGYVGPVFDFESLSGLLLHCRCVVSNCRCALSTRIDL